MKTITFCRDGEKVSDFDTAKWVDNFFASPAETFRISNIMPIHEIRARIKEGRIERETVQIFVESFSGDLSKFEIYKNGRGTGWAVEMAIQKGKRVWVFDMNTNAWYDWNPAFDKFFAHEGAPYLTKNFAGIGSRILTPEGERAIENVYIKTFAHEEQKEKG